MAEKSDKVYEGNLDPDIESEISQMMSDSSLDDLMSMSLGGAPSPSGSTSDADSASGRLTSIIPDSQRIEIGKRATGTVVIVGEDSILLEFGPKKQGSVARIQFNEEIPSVGESLEVNITRYDRNEGIFVCGRIGAVQKADWESLDEGMVVEARVTGSNKGGLEMEVSNHRAFMPAGQVSVWHVENLEEMIGQSLTCEVMEVNKLKKNIVLSHRAVMNREREEQKVKILESLEVGQVREGVVRKIMPFGAFVDLGGVDGLVHISDLSYSRVKDASEVIQEGQTVKVQVLVIDQENDRIGLGMKQLQDDPFVTTTSEVSEGDTLTGRITRTADFGAFVEIQPGVEGLIHISELSHSRVNRVDQVVKVDEIVKVQVLNVDPESRRISLSLKALAEKAEEDVSRGDDAALTKLKAKFGSNRSLKGGLG